MLGDTVKLYTLTLYVIYSWTQLTGRTPDRQILPVAQSCAKLSDKLNDG